MKFLADRFARGHSSPLRSGDVLDFMSDRNAALKICVPVDESVPFCHGSCGPSPDVSLMLREGYHPFDEIADKCGWSASERRVEFDIYTRLVAIRQANRLDAQVVESMKTGRADLSNMKPSDVARFLGKISAAKKRGFKLNLITA